MKGTRFRDVNNISSDVLECWSVSRACIVNLASAILIIAKIRQTFTNMAKIALGFFTILRTLKI
jgi:hypothetical protein